MTTVCRLLVLLTLCLAWLPPALWAQDDSFGNPTDNDKMSARIVAQLMERDHLLNHPIDDEIAGRAFDLYFKGLDPMKTYFLAADLSEFSQYRSTFDNQLKAADYKPAFEIFQRFLERVDQSTTIAAEWLAQPHDFTVDEEMVNEPDLLDWSADEAAMRERWRQRIKYSLLVARAEDKARDDSLARKAAAAAEAGEPEPPAAAGPPRLPPAERLTRRYQSFARRMHQMDNDNVIELFITALTTSFDPHTSYMSRKSFDNFMIYMSLKLDGIGATLQTDDEGYAVIKRIVPNGPADKQGELRVEDRVTAVGQGDVGEFVDVTGWALDDVVEKIRGQAGTLVRLSVMDQTGTDVREIRITRDRVQLEDEAAQGQIFEQGTRPDGSPRKIGVINLPSFYADMESPNSRGARSTTTDVARILQDFTREGVDALVLDLRTNGGGSLREAIDCTGLFIDRGPVVLVKDPYGSIEQLDDESTGSAWSKPLVVVTSKLSASASEILAGAVKDYHRGLIVGDTTTHGKGTVQSMVNLNELVYRSEEAPNHFGAIKITTQQFYRPNGDSTQLRGVLSDIVLPAITDKMDVAESDLDYAVKFDRIPGASFPQLSLINETTVEQLATQSRQRIEANDEFQKAQRKIDQYVQFKERTSLTLNEQAFFEQRSEFNAEEEDRQQMESLLNSDKTRIDRDYYLDEVIKIASDYATALGAG